MAKNSRQQNCKVGKKPTVKWWSLFKLGDTRHSYILSLAMQYGWTTTHKKSGREIADLKALDNWMRSKRCPVNKPLLDMTNTEVSKVIQALEQMTVKAHG